jgi:phospholipase/carboxylesterase
MKRARWTTICAITFFSILILSCTSSISQEAANAQYVKSQRFFKYIVELPVDYDSTSTYDLIVGLHGLGSNAEEFMDTLEEAGSGDMILVTLQAPYAIFEDDQPGYDWNLYETEDWELIFRAGEMSAELISDLLAALEKEYEIDNRYLLGFSQGGTQALYTGITRPELANGIISFGARFVADWYTESHIENMKRLRVFLAHGCDDARVSVEDSKAAHAFLEAAGADVELLIFNGVHEVPEGILREAIEWVDRDKK